MNTLYLQGKGFFKHKTRPEYVPIGAFYAYLCMPTCVSMCALVFHMLDYFKIASKRFFRGYPVRSCPNIDIMVTRYLVCKVFCTAQEKHQRY